MAPVRKIDILFYAFAACKTNAGVQASNPQQVPKRVSNFTFRIVFKARQCHGRFSPWHETFPVKRDTQLSIDHEDRRFLTPIE